MTSDDRSERRAVAEMKRVRARLDQEMRTSFPDATLRQRILDVVAPAVEDELRYKDSDIERARREAAHAKGALHWLRQQVAKAVYVHDRGDTAAGEVVKKVKGSMHDEQSVSPREIHFYKCVIAYPDNEVKDVNWGCDPEGDYNEVDYSTPQVSRVGGDGRIVIVSCFDLDLCREAFEVAKVEAQRELAARQGDGA